MALDFDTVYQRIESPARENFIKFVDNNSDHFSRWPADVSYVYVSQDKRYVREPGQSDIFNSSMRIMIVSAYRALPDLSDEELDTEFNKIPANVFKRLCMLTYIHVKWLHFRTQDLKVIPDEILDDVLAYAYSYIISISSVQHLAMLIDEMHTNWVNRTFYSLNDLFTVAEASVNELKGHPISWVLEITNGQTEETKRDE